MYLRTSFWLRQRHQKSENNFDRAVETSAKKCKKVQKVQKMAQSEKCKKMHLHFPPPLHPETKNRPYLWLHGSKCDSEGTYYTRNPPLFEVSTPQNCRNGRLRPQYLGPVGCGKLQAQPQRGGCPNGSTGSSRGKKKTFLKKDPRPRATLKQVFLDPFALVAAHFGPPKIPKCLENGLFWDQTGSKMGQKNIFPNLILDHLGCTNG